MKLLSTLISLILFAVALTFALSNRQTVTVNLWPFGYEVDAPIYLLTLGAMALGLLLGGGFVWMGALRHRWRARRYGRDVSRLSEKILDLEHELEGHRAREAAPDAIEAKQPFWRKYFKSRD